MKKCNNLSTENKKPYFMKYRWWYVKLPMKKRMPDYPYIDMVLSRRAPELAVLSYSKFFDLGLMYAFFWDNGKICTDDIYMDEEDWNRLIKIYNSDFI